MKNAIGIIQQIQSAKSAEKVQSLLNEAKTFKHAAADTKRKWLVVATDRLKELRSRAEDVGP